MPKEKRLPSGAATHLCLIPWKGKHVIKHIIMLKLKENALGKSKTENARIIKRDLESLRSTIKEIRHLEVGIDVAGGPDAYDVALYSEFADKNALETYMNHPDHVKVGEFVRSVRESRIVVDYEI